MAIQFITYTYIYTFINMFYLVNVCWLLPLNIFEFILSSIIATYVHKHTRGHGFVTDIELLFSVITNAMTYTCSYPVRHLGVKRSLSS